MFDIVGKNRASLIMEDYGGVSVIRLNFSQSREFTLTYYLERKYIDILILFFLEYSNTIYFIRSVVVMTSIIFKKG